MYAGRQLLCLAIIEFTHNTTSHPHDHQEDEQDDRDHDLENIEKGRSKLWFRDFCWAEKNEETSSQASELR